MGLAAALVLSMAVGFFAPGDGPGPPPPPDLSWGSSGDMVVELQQALAGLGFRPGNRDRFGSATRQAVLAFEKYHGLPRDGVFHGEYWKLLGEKPRVRWRFEQDRVEVDLGRQILFLIDENQVVAVLPVSSGTGRRYVNEYGTTVRARTPEGKFSFLWEYDGMREAFLGQMYRPYYFKRGGYAVHGSSSVPAYPASHGCIRIPNRDMDFLREHIELGMTIYVYGDRTAEPPVVVPTRLPVEPITV